jgi:Holliday junction resolvase RusA-like endonuclease
MNHIIIKPISVNECWMGRRFKTAKYKQYENDLLFLLPPLSLPTPPYRIELTFGLSSLASDFDNPIKPFIDILQKKYLFNDKHIMKAVINKCKVEKGKEYVGFKIEHFTKELIINHNP